MKKNLLIIILLSAAFAGKAQNLVPNGDFEQYNGCPDDLDQIDSASFWFSATGGTPDYYNQCAATIVGVPDNLPGFQIAHSGVAYSGLLTYWSLATDTREYIEVPLTTTLTANACYHFQMYVSCANDFLYATDQLSIYFSDTLIYVNSWNPLINIPQINNNLGFISDTLNWIAYTGNYTASGNENYLIIGNFKDDFNTSLLWINGSATFAHAYVLIDDVSLTPCTGIQQQNNSEAITIYPNPVKDELQVQSSKFKVGDQIKIYDVMGKEIYRNQLQTSNIKLQTSNYLPGIYFIEISTAKESYRKKFIKQ